MLSRNGSSTFLTLQTAGPYRLQTGYRKLRIDYVQKRPLWSTVGTTLIVYYSGPGLTRRLIPQDKIYYYNGHCYAKPTYFPVSSSTAWISGEGPIVAQGAVNVTICYTCDLQVLDDVLWHIDASTRKEDYFTNSGLIIWKYSPETAIFYGKLVREPATIRQKDTDSLLELPDANDTMGHLVTWSNAKGGSWLDPQNWRPQRIPRSEHIVHIRYPGVYRVIVPGNAVVSITSLSIGSFGSWAELVLEHSSILNIQDLVDIHVPLFRV